MDSSDPGQRGTTAAGRLQFSLHTLLVGTSVVAMYLAGLFYVRAPLAGAIRQAAGQGYSLWRFLAFFCLIALLSLVPLMLVALARACARRLATHDRASEPIARRWPNVFAPLRLLWVPADCTPGWIEALSVALASSVSVVILWPLVREVGHWIALGTLGKWPGLWPYIGRTAGTLARPIYWTSLWHWELCSMGRWWLLFAALAALWFLALLPLRARRSGPSASVLLRRLLMFAPWIIVLEIAFLAGVWPVEPRVVPEPSTGFVVGIFSWDLWHWDCWRNGEWLVRGGVPTLMAGTVFFRNVLEWTWAASCCGALLLVPVALMLSIATSVLY